MMAAPLILVVGETRPELDAAFANLSSRSPLRVMRMERPQTACARIGGGGVDAVLMHAASAVESIPLLREASRAVPVLVFCDPGDERAGEAAVRAGAAAYLTVTQSVPDMCRLLETALNLNQRPGPGRSPSSRAASGSILAFVGAKGGVGTTTVAQNAASILARDHRVILIELPPQFGALRHHFLARAPRRTLADLLLGEPSSLDVASLEACLWPYTALPGLRVLFGPLGTCGSANLSPPHVRSVLDCAAQFADYLVLDLPPSCSEANRTAIQRADLLALVLERDPVCLPCGRALLDAFEKWNVTPQSVGAVVVNRVGLANPFDLSRVEGLLGIPLFGAIPPAPEMSIAARQALMPLVSFDPEGIAAASIEQFVSHLRIRATAPPDMTVRRPGMRI